MKIVFIAPLPPPVSGHSLASRILLEELSSAHDVAVVNLNVGSRNDGTITGQRIIEVGKVLAKVWRKRKNADAIYLTISESPAGNLKDLLIYTLCLGKLSKMYIHLHGGSIGKLLFERHRVLRQLNAMFMRRFAAAIVTGPSHLGIFANMVDSARIYTVPNFAEDYLFVAEGAIRSKFAETSPLRILFMSSLVSMKGYNELADAVLRLSGQARKSVQVDFAGKFESELEKARFLEKISGADHIRYHGIVDGSAKQELLSRAHVLCLPTSYLEGQPIAILEAYASGCVVLSTLRGGIPDVFTPGVNGFAIRERSAEEVGAALGPLLGKTGELVEIAIRNRRAAGQAYGSGIFRKRLRQILESTERRQD